MIRNVCTNTAVATADYEVKIGKTAYNVHHKYGEADLTELIADYLAEKEIPEITLTDIKRAA